MEATETFEDEAAIQVLIDEIENAASVRAWTPEQKAACGVVVSLYDGELCVQRGVQKKSQTAASDGGEHGGEQASCMWSPAVCRMQQRVSACRS
jgi:ParB family chromosome partitioning protein